MHQPSGLRRHRGFPELSGVHFTEPLETSHVHYAFNFLRFDAVQDALSLTVVERVKNILADIDPEQWRHRDKDAPFRDQGRKMPRKQRTDQRRNMQPVRIRVGQNTNLVIPESRQVRGTGLNAQRQTDVVNLLGCEQLALIDFPCIEYLAPQGQDGLNFPITRLLRRTTGRVAFDKK